MAKETLPKSSPPAQPASQSVVPPMYSGHQDHSFTLQAIIEMQKTMGELKAIIHNNTLAISELKSDNTAAISSLKAKLDDLINWKNKILGGAIAVGAIIALTGFVISKFADYITIANPAQSHIEQVKKP